MKSDYHHGELPSALRAAALSLVRSGGLSSVTFAELARRAGVSSGAPYRHYASIDALFLDIARQALTRIGAEFCALNVAGGDPRDRVTAMGTTYVQSAVNNPAEFVVVRTYINLVFLTAPEVADLTYKPIVDAAAEVVGAADVHSAAISIFAIAIGFADISNHEITLKRSKLEVRDVVQAAGRAIRALVNSW